MSVRTRTTFGAAQMNPFATPLDSVETLPVPQGNARRW
jgi:hypothetical protein